MAVPAQAKINLCLDVIRRRPDGYHDLDTIFQRLALHDRIVLRAKPEGIVIHCEGAALPRGPRNIVYRAVEALRREYGVAYGAEICLHKRIPVAAGLGGGSADAAAILRWLPVLWHQPPLPRERLLSLARSLGADVPFCLDGVTARAGGIGDELVPLPEPPGWDVLLVKPAARLSTATIYAGLDLAGAEHPRVDLAAEAVRRGDLELLDRAAGNALERAAMAVVPEIAEIKAALRASGAPVALMTGSGPTVFALSAERGWAERTAAALARPGWTIIPTRTSPLMQEFNTRRTEDGPPPAGPDQAGQL